MNTYVIVVKGMTCGGCEKAIQKALGAVEGVKAVRPNHTTDRVEVEGVGIEIDSLKSAVEDAGYDWGGIA